MSQNATKAERDLRLWMAVSAVLYFTGGMVFLLLPRPLLTVLDSLAAAFHLATVLPGAMPA
jgi:hypothetical protein